MIYRTQWGGASRRVRRGGAGRRAGYLTRWGGASRRGRGGAGRRAGYDAVGRGVAPGLTRWGGASRAYIHTCIHTAKTAKPQEYIHTCTYIKNAVLQRLMYTYIYTHTYIIYIIYLQGVPHPHHQKNSSSSSSEESELDTHTCGGGSSSEESISGGGYIRAASTHMLHHLRMIAMTNCSLSQDDTIGQMRMNCSLISSRARMPFSMIR